jgi:hypothetical protein
MPFLPKISTIDIDHHLGLQQNGKIYEFTDNAVATRRAST